MSQQLPQTLISDILNALDDGDRNTAQDFAGELRDAYKALDGGSGHDTPVKTAVLMAIIDHAVDPSLCDNEDD